MYQKQIPTVSLHSSFAVRLKLATFSLKSNKPFRGMVDSTPNRV